MFENGIFIVIKSGISDFESRNNRDTFFKSRDVYLIFIWNYWKLFSYKLFMNGTDEVLNFGNSRMELSSELCFWEWAGPSGPTYKLFPLYFKRDQKISVYM